MSTKFQWKKDQDGNRIECLECLAEVPTATFSGRIGGPDRELCQLCATTASTGDMKRAVNGAANRIRLDLGAFKDVEEVTVAINYEEG